ncbi:MAG: hypothetical protein J6Y28_02280 [Acholeplasmatales bacterium]|nr:hypothetical protein [Acholeplasmatales bacterium]
MIKKNLIILLLIPFLIALIGAAAVKTTYKIIENDIIDIKWKYDDTEAFKVGEKELLEATYVAEKNYEISPGNELIWSIENKDKADEEIHAEILEENDKFYLNTLSIGDCIITCSNKKGNVSKSMNAIIYETGAIIINSEIKASQSNIDNTIYYGQYDLENSQKKNASFNLNIRVVPEDYKEDLYVVDSSTNLEFDLNSGVISINDVGDAYVTLGIKENPAILNQSYNFNVVKDGINVYTYDDLLYCTNQSSNGEIVVLRKSFESLTNYNLLKDDNNNIELFGHYNSKTKKFSFEDEIYKYETTYNHEFIEKWNNNIDSKSLNEPKLNDLVYAGLRIQKNIYGNGYTINMHNLTYPTGTSKITTDEGIEIVVPVLMPGDLYRGPLPFYALGDHNNMPLVETFGEDNCGMYVDGNNITVNDVNMKNCDFSNSLAYLDYVGTVININGDNNTIKNSRVSNGKNVVRAFSTENLEIKNSLLSNARNFLLFAGSNEYIKPDETKEYEFTLYDGTVVTSTISEFFANGGLGDQLLTDYATGNFDDKLSMYQAIQSTQKALCDDSGLYDENDNLIYKGKIDVTDVFFYRSGVSSIGLDSMFDGAYLYSSIPGVINTYLGKLETQNGNKMSDLLTNNTGGQSYPIELNINGKTRFYDYKETNNIDISGLITENIKSFAQAAADAMGITVDTSTIDINIDKIFPIKGMIIDNGETSIYQEKYIDCVIAYYGGGNNHSKVSFNDSEAESNINKEIKVNLLHEYIYNLNPTDSTTTMVKYLMMKAVTTTTGYSPFRFVCYKNNGYLFGETPNIKDLKNN